MMRSQVRKAPPVCIVTDYSAFDVVTSVIFGVFGYAVRRLGFPAAPLVLNLILTPKLERSFHPSMGAGSVMIFLNRPITAAFVSVLGLIIIKPVAQWFWRQRYGRKEKV